MINFIKVPLKAAIAILVSIYQFFALLGLAKTLIIFAVNTGVFFALHYFLFNYVEHVPGMLPAHNMIVMRVEHNDGTPFEGRMWGMAIYQHTGEEWIWRRSEGSFAMRRFVYQDYDNIFAIRFLNPLPERGWIFEGRPLNVDNTILLEIPIEVFSPRDRVTINIDTGEMRHEIAFSDYLWGIFDSHPVQWTVLVFAAVLLINMTVFGVLALVFMFMGLAKPSRSKRYFYGSWIHLAFCVVFSGAVIAAPFMDMEDVADFIGYNDPVIMVALIFYIVGTLIYPFAFRAYDGQYLKYMRGYKAIGTMTEDYIGALAFGAEMTTTTVTTTTWSDGTRTVTKDDDSAAMGWIGLAIMIGIWAARWVIKLAAAPFTAYFALIRNYLITKDPALLEEEMKAKHKPIRNATALATALGQSTVGKTVFAWWEKDNRFYPGIVSGITEGVYTVNFLDGHDAAVPESGIWLASQALGDGMKIWAAYQGGTYYECKIISATPPNYRVMYELDGVTEDVTIKQLRAEVK